MRCDGGWWYAGMGKIFEQLSSGQIFWSEDWVDCKSDEDSIVVTIQCNRGGIEVEKNE